MKPDRPTSSQRRLAHVLVFVVVALIACVAISFTMGRSAEVLDGLRGRAVVRGDALDTVRSAMADATFAQRDFTASARPEDRALFDGARRHLEAALSTMREAHADEPAAATAIARIDRIARDHIDELQRRADAAVHEFVRQPTLPHTAAVRRLIDELKLAERDAYDARAATAQHQRVMLLLIETLVCALMIAISFAGYQFLVVEAREEEARNRQREVDALSEKRLRQLTDNLPALIAHIDADEVLQYANGHFLACFGTTADAVLGRTLADTHPAGAYATMAPHVKRALAGHEVSFEHEVAVGGDALTFHTTYVPHAGPDGQVRGFHAIAIDITHRILAEQRLADGERRLRDVTNNIPALIAYFDADERCEFANEHARRHLRTPAGGFEHGTLAEMFTGAQYAQFTSHVAAMRAGRRVQFETMSDSKVSLHQTAHAIPDLGDDGEFRGFYLMVHDVTALKRAEQSRAEGERHLKSITDNVPALIMHIDPAQRITFANAMYKEWLGAPPEQMVGRLLVDAVGERLYGERREALERALRGERHGFSVVSEALGITRHLETVYVPDVREDGSVAGVFTFSTDVSALKAVESRLRDLARIDTLTGLPNRRQFDETLEAALARTRRHRHDLALLFLDVDHFKAINDTEGHAGGDAVLVEFASRLRQCVRETDHVARLAGDEFVVLLEGPQDPGAVAAVAEKIRASVERPIAHGDRALHITTSIGIALADADTRFPAAFVAKADAALYEAKRAGRNTYALAA